MAISCAFDPLNTFYKSVTGAVKENKNIKFRIKGDFCKVDFVYHKDGGDPCYLPMKKRNGYFEISVSFSVGLYWYNFDLNNGLFVGVNSDNVGTITEIPTCFQLSVYSADYVVPKWIKGGIIYQIFPDRFFRSENYKIDLENKIIHKDVNDDPVFLPNNEGEVLNNDFFGGNIRGIIEKLDYLKSLNVTAIYLNPIFKAFSNHRYDTGDYMQTDPLLGTEEDLCELIKKADKLNINIILDGVFNHVGADSVYFNKYGNYPSVGAYQSKNSEYYKWFDFIEYPDEYMSWWGIKTLPAVNKQNSEYIDYICGEKGVISHYLGLGVKGLRLDVVDELPQEFVRILRHRVKTTDKNAVIIGEVWEDASNKISYGRRREYFLGKELDSVMNYPLKNAIIGFVKDGDAKNLSRTIKLQTDHYPKKTLDVLMNILSTHDTARLLSAVSDIEIFGKTKSELAEIYLNGEQRAKAVTRLKAASLLQFTLFGVPSVYYGDEAGMQGFFDPLNRKYFPWDGIDEEIFFWYKKLGEIRNENSVFKSGNFKEIYCADGFYAFERISSKNSVFVMVNVKEKVFDVEFSGKIINILDDTVYENKIHVVKNFLGIFKKCD